MTRFNSPMFRCFFFFSFHSFRLFLNCCWIITVLVPFSGLLKHFRNQCIWVDVSRLLQIKPVWSTNSYLLLRFLFRTHCINPFVYAILSLIRSYYFQHISNTLVKVSRYWALYSIGELSVDFLLWFSSLFWDGGLMVAEVGFEFRDRRSNSIVCQTTDLKQVVYIVSLA